MHNFLSLKRNDPEQIRLVANGQPDRNGGPP